MAQQQWSAGPPVGGNPPGGPGRSGPRALWWVVIGVVALVLVGLVAFAVLGGMQANRTTAPTPTVTTAPTEPIPTASTGQPTDEPTEADWGPMPPPDPGALKELFEPTFPDVVGSFALDGEPMSDSGGALAGYDDAANYRGFTASISYGGHHYARLVANLTDPAYHGGAVCGTINDGVGDQWSCVMAGTDGALEAGTASVEDVTLEELAALTQELYAGL